MNKISELIDNAIKKKDFRNLKDDALAVVVYVMLKEKSVRKIIKKKIVLLKEKAVRKIIKKKIVMIAKIIIVIMIIIIIMIMITIIIIIIIITAMIVIIFFQIFFFLKTNYSFKFRNFLNIFQQFHDENTLFETTYIFQIFYLITQNFVISVYLFFQQNLKHDARIADSIIFCILRNSHSH